MIERLKTMCIYTFLMLLLLLIANLVIRSRLRITAVLELVDLQVTTHNLSSLKGTFEKVLKLLEGDEFVASIREGLINPAAYPNIRALAFGYISKQQALRNVILASLFIKEITWLHDVLCEYCN